MNNYKILAILQCQLILVKKIIQILILNFGIHVLLFAQLPKYHAQVFGEAFGIKEGRINSIFQDNNGLLWMLSYTELESFDGRSTRKYSFSNNIEFVQCDYQNDIWALSTSSNQLYKLDRIRDRFVPIDIDTSKGRRLKSLFITPNQILCLLSNNCTMEYNPQTKKWMTSHLAIPGDGTHFHMNRIDTNRHILYIPVSGGIAAFNLRTNKYKCIETPKEFSHLFAVDTSLAIMTGYLGDSYWLDFDRMIMEKIDARLYGLSTHQDEMKIISCCPLNNNTYLLCSGFGLVTFDRQKNMFKKQSTFHEGIPFNNDLVLYRLFKGRDDIYWATDRANLIGLKSTEHSIGLLRNYNFNNADRWDNRVRTIVEDNNENIWFGGFYGIRKINQHTGKIDNFFNTPNLSGSPYFYLTQCIKFDGTNLVVALYIGGIYFVNPVNLKTKRPTYVHDSVRIKLERDVLDYVGILHNGDLIVCGRFNVYYIEGKTYKTKIIHFEGDKSNMNTVFQDKYQNIWLGATNKLICLNQKLDPIFTYNLPNGTSVNFFYPFGTNNIFCGTTKGILTIMYNDTLQPTVNLDTIFHKPNLTFYSVIQDKLKRFWFGTNEGLLVTDSNLRALIILDYTDNVQSHLFFESSAIQTKSGLFLFGGLNGLNYFTPENIKFENQSLNASLQTLGINEDTLIPLYQKNDLSLAYWQNTLSFEIKCPYYNNTSKLQFKYNLKGDSSSWIHIGSNHNIKLFSLPPGDYQLQIGASINQLNWIISPSIFRFTIKQPFWKTYWFSSLIISGVFLCIWYFLKLRDKKRSQKQRQELEFEQLKNKSLQYEMEVRQQLEEKEKSILEVEKRSAQLQLTTLTNHLNPHFLFNSLTSLNSLIFENQELASRFLQHLSKVYRYLLQNKDKDTVSLRQEIDFVENFTELQKIRFNEDIVFIYQIEEDAIEMEIVPVTLQVLIENCIKHNMLSPKNPLKIEIYTSSNRLFVRNNIQKKTLVEHSNHRGLESLIQLYQYLTSSKIEILQNETQFIVSIPLL